MYNHDEIYQNVYNKEKPNAYVANFSVFVD